MIINNLTFLDSLVSVCSPLIDNKILLTFVNFKDLNITTLFISTIVVLLPLIIFSKTGKIITRAGNGVLAGGAFAAGEQLVDGILDGVKGWIPVSDSGSSSETTGGTSGGTSGGT